MLKYIQSGRFMALHSPPQLQDREICNIKMSHCFYCLNVANVQGA